MYEIKWQIDKYLREKLNRTIRVYESFLNIFK